MNAPGPVTLLLARARAGDRAALDQLFPLVYEQLRRTAQQALRAERPGHTLQPTALVNEAYLKLIGAGNIPAADRHHFVLIAARAMRQVLVDHARRRGAVKRGDGRTPVALDMEVADDRVDLEELIALDDALERLSALNPRLRMIVELRFFGGLEEKEIAESLGVTTRTVQRDWAKARAWLHRAVGGMPASEGGSD